VRINICAREKREHDCPEAGYVVDPRRQRQAYGVAGDSADDDLK
jgi:hypothetical protein